MQPDFGNAGSISIGPSCDTFTKGGGFAGSSAPGSFRGSGEPETLADATVRADTPPPPLSGGTLLATHDGKLLVASDPDRDIVYFIDSAAHTLLHIRKLNAGDEPGRLVEDAAGRIHIALRSGHALVTLTRDPESAMERREICDLPRGLAYDAARDLVQVACAEGKLVSIAAAPSGGVSRVVDVGRDARDVIVRGDQLYVTRFRSAELLTLDASGKVVETHQPPTFSQQEFTQPELVTAPDGSCNFVGESKPVTVANTPTIAWRAIDVPGKGVAMLHQRARTSEIQVTAGGYGAGSNCGAGIVQSSITVGMDGQLAASADLMSAALAIDVAVDADGLLLAVVAPGNRGFLPQVQVFQVGAVGAQSVDTAPDVPTPAGEVPASSLPFPTTPGVGMPTSCLSMDRPMDESAGQATAVAFASPYVLAVQNREPAGISFVDLRTGAVRATLDLKQASRFDTGHELFHMRAGAGIACASCHAEGGDDSHVWTFHGIGARRTQNLRGGILGTEPFHWNGDMADFPALVREVFVGRMAGFEPRVDQTDALSHWIDKQPELKTQPHDLAAVARGKALFESDAVACSSCHAGEHLTNNKLADVGTGAMLQVPSLRGVSFRSPLMHDGCAKTLADRFGSCGGGDKHGHTSQLNATQTGDIVSYLETL